MYELKIFVLIIVLSTPPPHPPQNYPYHSVVWSLLEHTLIEREVPIVGVSVLLSNKSPPPGKPPRPPILRGVCLRRPAAVRRPPPERVFPTTPHFPTISNYFEYYMYVHLHRARYNTPLARAFGRNGPVTSATTIIIKKS